MNKINWKQKLSSRKLWIAIIGVVVGLAAAFGIDTNDYAQIAGIITSAVSVVTYVFGESRVDAASSVPINLNINETPADSDDEMA